MSSPPIRSAICAPRAVQTYIDEIRKVTSVPIKWVVYNHHHYNHGRCGREYAGGRLGTRDDVRDLKQYRTELSDAVRQAADQGTCFDQAMREVRLPRYEKWSNYEQHLPGNVERFCEFWGRGF